MTPGGIKNTFDPVIPSKKAFKQCVALDVLKAIRLPGRIHKSVRAT